MTNYKDFLNEQLPAVHHALQHSELLLSYILFPLSHYYFQKILLPFPDNFSFFLPALPAYHPLHMIIKI